MAVNGLASGKCLNTADNRQEDATMSKKLADLKTDVSNKSGRFPAIMVLIYLKPNMPQYRQNTHMYRIHSVCLSLMICILELTMMAGKYKYKQYCFRK